MKKIATKSKNTEIEQIYRLSTALFLKTSGRTIQRAEAQKILQDLSKEDLHSIDLAVDVFLNLSELLLDELKSSGSDIVLKELKFCFNELLRLSKKNNIRLIAAHRTVLQTGTEQHLASNHCFRATYK